MPLFFFSPFFRSFNSVLSLSPSGQNHYIQHTKKLHADRFVLQKKHWMQCKEENGGKKRKKYPNRKHIICICICIQKYCVVPFILIFFFIPSNYEKRAKCNAIPNCLGNMHIRKCYQILMPAFVGPAFFFTFFFVLLRRLAWCILVVPSTSSLGSSQQMRMNKNGYWTFGFFHRDHDHP